MALTKRQSMDLDILAISLDLAVHTAVQANVVMWGANDIFAKDPEHKLFAWNPVNTLLYRALHALEDRCIVEIAEALKDEHRRIPNGMTVRGKADLVNHRNAVSHTWTISWRRPEMQVFFDTHRQWTDLRLAIVWDMWRSFNEGLIALGEPPKNMAISVGPIHAAMLHTILRYSMKPEAASSIPSEQDLVVYMTRVADALLDFIVARPEGRRTTSG
jgi:hypothetical protein